MSTELQSLNFFFLFWGGGVGWGSSVAGWPVGKSCISFRQKRFSIGMNRGS